MTELELFTNKLQDAELKLKMTHDEFAIFLEFPRSSVVKWIQGRNLPSEKRQEIVLAKIKSKLG